MPRIALAIALLMLHPTGAASQRSAEWTQFGMRESGVVFEVPPSFALDTHAENGQQARFLDDEGSVLNVVGKELAPEKFVVAVNGSMERDQREGWEITYRRSTPTWASYSGIRGDTIRYYRAIAVCGNRAAYFTLDYDRKRKTAFDPIVERMVLSMREEC